MQRLTVGNGEGRLPTTRLDFGSAMPTSTATSWRDRSALRIWSGRRTLSVSRCLTDSQNQDRRVFRMARRLRYEVATECMECSGPRAPAKCCLYVSERVSDIEIIAHSLCRWEIEVICKVPVSMHRTAFCSRCSFLIAELGSLGNQTRPA